MLPEQASRAPGMTQLVSGGRTPTSCSSLTCSRVSLPRLLPDLITTHGLLLGEGLRSCGTLRCLLGWLAAEAQACTTNDEGAAALMLVNGLKSTHVVQQPAGGSTWCHHHPHAALSSQRYRPIRCFLGTLHAWPPNSWPQHSWKQPPQQSQLSAACSHQVGPPAGLQHHLRRCLLPQLLQGWLTGCLLQHCRLQLHSELPQRLHRAGRLHGEPAAGCLHGEPAAGCSAAALPSAGQRVSCE